MVKAGADRSAAQRRYQCRDGWLAVACRSEAHWKALAKCLGRPELAYPRAWEAAVRAPPQGPLAQVLEFLELGRGQGAIILTEKHCDPHIFDDPLLKSRLEERGIPCLQLDSELALRGVGQFRTRLQTFVEMVRSGERP